MPPVTPTEIRQDKILTNFLVQHPAQEFVAHRVFPIVPVKQEGGEYYKIRPGDRIVKDSTRARGTESAKVSYGYTTDSYSCEEFALHADAPGRDIRDADDPLDVLQDAAYISREMTLLDIERRVAAIAQASTLPKASPAATWDNATLSSADPFDDVETGKEVIRQKIGKWPNAMLLPAACASALRKWLMNQKNGGGVEFSTMEQYLKAGTLPPTIWGMEVIIAGATKSAVTVRNPDEVDLTALSDVWTDNVTLFYKAPMPGKRMISFGYSFRVRGSELAHRGYYTGARDPMDQWAEYRVIEDHKLVAAECAYMIENVLE